MGLIKTAIMTGGGLYAVNKLSKVVVARQDSPNRAAATADTNARQYDTRAHFQFPSDPNVPPYPTRDPYDDPRRHSQPAPPGYYLANDNTWAPLPHGYLEREARLPAPERYASEPPTRAYSPPYYASTQQRHQRQQQQMGFVEPDEDVRYEPLSEPRSSSASPLPALADQVMTYAMGHGKGNSSRKGGQTDMLASLFSK